MELQATLELSNFPASELWVHMAKKIRTFDARVARTASSQEKFVFGRTEAVNANRAEGLQLLGDHQNGFGQPVRSRRSCKTPVHKPERDALSVGW